MGNLGDALQKHAKRLGIEKQVEASDVVEKAIAEIAKFIPREDFEVISFKDGVLKVGADSSSAKNEILLKLGPLFLKDNNIKRLSFSAKPVLKEE